MPPRVDLRRLNHGDLWDRNAESIQYLGLLVPQNTNEKSPSRILRLFVVQILILTLPASC